MQRNRKIKYNKSLGGLVRCIDHLIDNIYSVEATDTRYSYLEVPYTYFVSDITEYTFVEAYNRILAGEQIYDIKSLVSDHYTSDDIPSYSADVNSDIRSNIKHSKLSRDNAANLFIKFKDMSHDNIVTDLLTLEWAIDESRRTFLFKIGSDRDIDIDERFIVERYIFRELNHIKLKISKSVFDYRHGNRVVSLYSWYVSKLTISTRDGKDMHILEQYNNTGNLRFKKDTLSLDLNVANRKDIINVKMIFELLTLSGVTWKTTVNPCQFAQYHEDVYKLLSDIDK